MIVGFIKLYSLTNLLSRRVLLKRPSLYRRNGIIFTCKSMFYRGTVKLNPIFNSNFQRTRWKMFRSSPEFFRKGFHQRVERKNKFQIALAIPDCQVLIYIAVRVFEICLLPFFLRRTSDGLFEILTPENTNETDNFSDLCVFWIKTRKLIMVPCAVRLLLTNNSWSY